MEAFSRSSVFLVIFIFLISDVRSDFSFNFPNFDPATVGNQIGLQHDAKISNNILQLTKKDENGEPLQHTVGQSAFMTPVQIYDKASGKVAGFATEFSFVVDRRGRSVHGDGLTFFLRAVGPDFPDEEESGGGFLGIFTHDTSSIPTVAVEFDTYPYDEWDPHGVIHATHVGIDVNSVVSAATVLWLVDVEPDNVVGHASISYDSTNLQMSVSVTYPDDDKRHPLSGDCSLKYNIDLRAVLPERVLVGFSAASGDMVETHDIVSWSFTSNM